MAALVIIWNLAAPPLTTRFGNTPDLLASQGGMVLAFLAFISAREPAGIYLILILAAFGNGLGRTAATASVSLAAETDRRGEAMGVQGTVSPAQTAGGPLLAGWIFVSVLPSAPFAIIACFAATGFVATATYMVQNRNKAE